MEEDRKGEKKNKNLSEEKEDMDKDKDEDDSDDNDNDEGGVPFTFCDSKAIGFHSQAKTSELNFLIYTKKFHLDGETRQGKLFSQPVNLPAPSPKWYSCEYNKANNYDLQIFF